MVVAVSPCASRLAVFRCLFIFAMILTLVGLLMPASTILALREWSALWLPWSALVDNADPSVHTDKIVHVGLFLLLGALAARSWPYPRGRVFAWLGLFLLGCLTEWLQQFVPGRGASVFDLAADVAGASLGLLWVSSGAKSLAKVSA